MASAISGCHCSASSRRTGSGAGSSSRALEGRRRSRSQRRGIERIEELAPEAEAHQSSLAGGKNEGKAERRGVSGCRNEWPCATVPAAVGAARIAMRGDQAASAAASPAPFARRFQAP
jgi:hypothetical protein